MDCNQTFGRTIVDSTVRVWLAMAVGLCWLFSSLFIAGSFAQDASSAKLMKGSGRGLTIKITDRNGEVTQLTAPSGGLSVTCGKTRYSLDSTRMKRIVVDPTGAATVEVQGCPPIKGVLKGKLSGETDFGKFTIAAEKIAEVSSSLPDVDSPQAATQANVIVLDKAGQRTSLSQLEFAEGIGLTVRKGAFEIKVDSSGVAKITVDASDNATVTFASKAEPFTGKLVTRIDNRYPPDLQMKGSSAMGEMSVNYQDVSSIEFLHATSRPTGMTSTASGSTYTVEDSRGTRLVLQELHWYYEFTSGGGWNPYIGQVPSSTNKVKASYLPVWSSNRFARILTDHIARVTLQGRRSDGRPILIFKVADGTEIPGYLDMAEGVFSWQTLHGSLSCGEVVLPFTEFCGLSTSQIAPKAESSVKDLKGPPMTVLTKEGTKYELKSSGPVTWSNGYPTAQDAILKLASGSSTLEVPFSKIKSIRCLGGTPPSSGAYKVDVVVTSLSDSTKNGTVEVAEAGGWSSGNESRHYRTKFGGPTAWGDIWFEWGAVDSVEFHQK